VNSCSITEFCYGVEGRRLGIIIDDEEANIYVRQF